MNVLHVIKNGEDADYNLQKLVNIQTKSLKYNISVMTVRKALFSASIRKFFGRPFDAIHVHARTSKFNKLSKNVINQDISDFFLKKEFYADSEFQLLLNKEILFYYSDGNQKAVISLIESIKYLSSEYTLRIIKNIPEADLKAFKELIENLNIKHRVSFGLSSENLSIRDLAKAYKDSRLVVFNSIGTNLKMKIVKALACGIPVIAFSNEKYLEIPGLKFTELQGPKALAKKIRDIVEDDFWVDIESVYNTYSLESLAESLDKKYQGLNNN